MGRYLVASAGSVALSTRILEAAAFGPPRQPRIGMAAWNLVGYFETRTIDLRIEVRSYTVGDGRKTRCVRNRPAVNVTIPTGLRS